MNRELSDRTAVHDDSGDGCREGVISPPYTLAEAELFFEMFGHWPQSRVPVERYLDPGFAQTLTDEIGAAAVRRVPEGHPLRPLIAAIAARGRHPGGEMTQ